MTKGVGLMEIRITRIFTGLIRMFTVQNPHQSRENPCNPHFH
ncbi:MAG: hypothetical protein RIS64_785 [Bacteroidota bacterium]|jgi:hypothetical protein